MATSEMPATCASRSSMNIAQLLELLLLVADEIPLVDGDDEGAPLVRHHLADREVLLLEGMLGVDQQHHHLGEAQRTHGIAGGELLGGLADARLAPEPRRVEQADGPATPGEVRGHRVAGEAGLGTRDHALLAQQRVDQRRLAGVGAADDGEADGKGLGIGLFHDLLALAIVIVIPPAFANRRQAKCRKNGGCEIAQALAVLGRDGDRLAQPQLVGVVEALRAGAPLALVGDQDGGPPGLAHDAGERRVGRHHAVAGVEHEQHQVRTRDRRLALGAHARGDAVRRRLLEPRRVDEGHLVAGQLRLALAAVARQARHVRDQRGALGGELVEERRLADVGPADDGDGWGHVGSCDQGRRAPGTRPGWRGHALIGPSAAGRQCRLGAEEDVASFERVRKRPLWP